MSKGQENGTLNPNMQNSLSTITDRQCILKEKDDRMLLLNAKKKGIDM